MKFTIIISKLDGTEKSHLYSTDFEINNNETFLQSKNAVPTIINKAIDVLLSTNIPEEIQEYINNNINLDFNIVGKGVNVNFELKTKR